MKKIYQLTLTFLFALVATSAFSQTDRFWSANNEIRSSITTDKAVARLSFPKEFKLYSLNIEPLRNELFKVVDNHKSTIISLPNADGGLEQFEVYEASNFVPALQARFPEIRAFSGRGITDKYATLKLSISPQGIQTMVFRTEKANEFIEAYSKDHTVYAVFRSQRNKDQYQWTCSTPEADLVNSLNSKVAGSNLTGSSTGELKTMLLAQSCNAEYSNYFGAFNIGQIGLVYAAFNATLTRCNGCYEKDLALHLNLISNTFEDQIIFFDPATDPYTTLGNWNNQLQALLTAVVGDANYDIGHMFGASGGGGNAGCIGCVCVAGIKGRGITSPADNIPQGDNFDIDYVVHEVGHQLGANHTFSHGLEGTGVNKEVGAGITIMGYAGITSYDPAPHSIDIYHEASIAQIQTNLATKTCPITTVITANNATPVVNPVSNYIIPISTPFALTGSATDANNDPLTYCWEQNDNATTSGANSVASPGKLTGPNWLTFPATVSGTRLMPRLSTILAGLFVTPPLPGGDAVCNIEALSSVSRTLNFRLTVRDNCPYVPGVKVGQTAFTDMVVTVTNTSGPFMVTSPNTNVTWAGGSSQTITWDVNGTTGAPVSCANVKISLSTDGGNTFPTVLSASTTNDGSEVVTLPNITTATARVKIEAVGNIFFDISNSNFNINAASNPTFTFVTPAPTTVACGTASAAITLATTSVMGFVTPINLVASGLPGSTTVSYSVNPVVPGNSTVVTLNNMNTLAPGSYPITITGTAGAEVKTVLLTYIVSAGAGPAITVQPTPQTICAGLNTSFTVTSPTATGFQWQLSTTGAGGPFNNISNGGVYSNVTTATLNITGATAGMDGYQYRCVASVLCGSTNSNPALLTVQTAPAITSSPANATICAGSSTSFSVSATGTGLTYQWQVAVAGCGGTWTNLSNAAPYSGVTTATLTINPTTAAMTGYGYRCVVSGTCTPAANSGCAVLTVNTPIAISSQPAASTICAGAQTSFTVGASGTTPTYQWQESTTGAGGPWTNITNTGVYSGATTATLTLTGVTAGMTGYQYRVVVTGAAPCVSATSNPGILTVNTAPVITTQPVVSTTLCVGGNTTYTVAASGTAVAFQWQVSTTGAGGPWTNLADGGVYSGTATASMTITGATALMNNNQYRAVATGTCSPVANSNATALTVNTPITITTQPAATTNICATGSTSLTVAATGTTPTYQWQVSTTGAGGPWTNITNGGVYGGATTTTLTMNAVTAAMNAYQYRVVVTGAAPCTPVNSAPAVLNVTPQPVISATPTSLLAGQQTTLTVNVTPAPGLSFAWYLNGVLVPGATSNTIVATVNSLGSYRVIVTSGTGSCQSELLDITATPSTKLFIFPSPNNGLFKVSYYTANASTANPTKQNITIYDSYGRRVLNKEYEVRQAYQLHQMDLRAYGAGIYYVVLREANGNKIKTGEVVVR
jgi:hypothetical protein